MADFERDGFIVVPDLLAPSDVAALRNATELPQVRESLQRKGLEQGLVHDLEITVTVPEFQRYAAFAPVLDVVEALIGPDIQIHHSKLAAKPAVKGGGAGTWHQDFPFYPHSNTDLVTAFLYLDDTGPDNGCMTMVKGSHRRGPASHTDASGHFAAGLQDPGLYADESLLVPIEVKAGTVSFHHCLTIHGSGVNHSGRPRRGLAIQYRAADAAQLGGFLLLDSGRQVRGSFKGRIRCTEGVHELPYIGHMPGYDGYGAYERLVGSAAGLGERVPEVVSR
ncbi:MAG: phytanoyl-CoA dioxygenase family protein [Candidatus Dormibacteria bacterium]